MIQNMTDDEKARGMCLAHLIDANDGAARYARIRFAFWVLAMMSMYGVKAKSVCESIGRSPGRVSIWATVAKVYGPVLGDLNGDTEEQLHDAQKRWLQVCEAWSLDALYAWRPERSNLTAEELVNGPVRFENDAPKTERAKSEATVSDPKVAVEPTNDGGTVEPETATVEPDVTTVSANNGAEPTATFTVARRTFTALVSAKRETESWDDLFGRLLTGNVDAMVARGVVQGNAPSRDTRTPGPKSPKSTTKGNAPRQRA